MDIGICKALKACRLMALSPAPPSIRTWCILTLEMVGETTMGKSPAPAMLDGQSEASKLTGVPIHFTWAVNLDMEAVAAMSRRSVLTARREVSGHEPPNMTLTVRHGA